MRCPPTLCGFNLPFYLHGSPECAQQALLPIAAASEFPTAYTLIAEAFFMLSPFNYYSHDH